MRRRQDLQSRVLHELSSLVLNLLRPPTPPIQLSGDSPAVSSPSSSWRRLRDDVRLITPAGFASMMLGMSLALMLCGSVTFFIGFLLMPWVIGLVMIFYVVGFVSSLSVLCRAIISDTSTPPSPRKGIPAWKY